MAGGSSILRFVAPEFASDKVFGNLSDGFKIIIILFIFNYFFIFIYYCWLLYFLLHFTITLHCLILFANVCIYCHLTVVLVRELLKSSAIVFKCWLNKWKFMDMAWRLILLVGTWSILKRPEAATSAHRSLWCTSSKQIATRTHYRCPVGGRQPQSSLRHGTDALPKGVAGGSQLTTGSCGSRRSTRQCSTWATAAQNASDIHC